MDKFEATSTVATASEVATTPDPDAQAHTKATLGRAMRALDAVCDGALARDYSGFNAFDSAIGKSLSRRVGLWTYQDARNAFQLARKYRGQLSGMGIEVADLVMPEAPVVASDSGAPKSVKGSDAVARLDFLGYQGGARLTFRYDPKLVAEIQPLKRYGARFISAQAGWLIPHTEDGWRAMATFVDAHCPTEDAEALRDQLGVSKGEPVAIAASPSPAIEERPKARYELNGNGKGDLLRVSFDYNPAWVDAIKRVGGARWNSSDRVWELAVRPEMVEPLAHFADLVGVPLPDGVADAVLEHIFALSMNREASKALDGDQIDIPGITFELRPFQRAGVHYLVKNRRVLLADEMGLGKSVQSLAATIKLDGLPLLIVCPASLKYNWLAEVRKWFPALRVAVLGGTKATALPEADVIVLNYDVIGAWAPLCEKYGFKTLVCDEAHYLKNKKAARSMAVVGLAQNPGLENLFLLTGTPVMNRPLELVNILKVLGKLDDFGGESKFKFRYCGPTQTWGGHWQFQGSSNEEELSVKLAERCMVRRRTREVMTELPPVQRVTVPVDLAPAIRREYDQAQREFELLIAHDSDGTEHVVGARKHTGADVLVHIERCKQISARGKMSQVKDWIDEFLANSGDAKLLVFAHHQDVQAQIASWYPGCMTIVAEQDAKVRLAEIDRFQTDPSVRVGVLSLLAGGVGLTITEAHYMLFVEFGWRPGDHSQAEGRAYGRLNDAHGVTSYWMVSNDTIDEDIVALINSKQLIADTVHDGFKVLENDITEELVESLRAKLSGAR